MDSNKIKNLAFGARDALRAEVAARIDAVIEPSSSERLDQPEKTKQLEVAINEKGLDAVIESTAYTWFNRLCALRFMDAKGYTPVPVVTPRQGATQPAVLADAAQGIFDPDFGFSRLVRDRVQSILAGGSGSSANRTEAAYGELLVAVCDHYAEAMPYLFGETAASSLVLPQGLLAEDSILSRIVEDMDDEECETVEVLGWLYQFYVAERRAEFNEGGRKATADDIAPATQLFTPEWIVKYLVENSLGRLWMLNNPGSALADKMDYYIASEGETEDFIRVYSPEELTLCDPACGSGHILVYAFDLLFEVYQEEGYFPEDIPALILRNNLFGMEIDGRAAEIAKFALEMKAREKDPSFFERHIDANVTVLESVKFESGALADAGPIARASELLEAFEHMTEVGSLYVPAPGDMAAVDNAIASFSEDDLLGVGMLKKLRTMKNVLEILARTFDCVVANPPYLAFKKFNDWMSPWARSNYPITSNDLFSMFIERNTIFAVANGEIGIMSPFVWMSLISYETLRMQLISSKTITTFIELEYSGFEGATVPICTFTLCNSRYEGFEGTYIRLADFPGPKLQSPKALEAIRDIRCNWRYSVDQQRFLSLPSAQIAYWATKADLEAYRLGKPLRSVARPRQGLVTGCNDAFLRVWWEPALSAQLFNASSRLEASESGKKWFPANKGGSFRKWYGNRGYIVNWRNDGEDIKAFIDDNGRQRSRPQNADYYFQEGITWGTTSSAELSMRYVPAGSISEHKGSMCFSSVHTDLLLVLGLCNSSLVKRLLKVLAPTIDFGEGALGSLPVVEQIKEVSELPDLINDCICISKVDYDSFETSWDFGWHPLAYAVHDRMEQPSYSMNSDAHSAFVSLISERFKRWSAECDERFGRLKANEEELNRIFARIYNMEGEVPIEVPDDKVSVRRADLVRDVKSLISYGVGCIMGRYSAFTPGLILADAQQTVDDFKAKVPDVGFLPDEDAIIPVLDGEWFGDDIVAQFRKWLEVTYGADTLDENIRFIEDALGKDLRKYFVKEFYKDHCATYQVTGSGKRPIYWMFASPKGSFQALVYMHRYTPSTVGLILTKYLREYVEKLNAKIGQLDQSDRAADKRQADKYRAVVRELTEWERDVIYPIANERVSIDLDDGVKVNYNKFPHALAKVAGLSEWK